MAYRIGQDDALMQRSWEDTLWNESQEKDIYSGLVGVYSDKDESLTDTAVMRVNMPKGSRDHTIGLVLDLVGAGRQGGGKNLVGFTEALDTRKFTVYANDLRHAVDTEQYGIYAFYNTPYGLLQKVNPLIARWLKARRGKHARQAGLELISDNLEEAPTSRTSGWNHNILIKNVAHDDQPTYDSTLATYTANIKDALPNAPTSTSQVDIQFFTDLEYFITNKWKMQPFDDGSYVVTVPSRQAIALKRFNTGENAAGDLDSFSAHFNRSQVEKYVKAAYGQYLMTFGKLHLIVDDRAPIIDHDTSVETITPYYRDVGSTDARAARTNGANNNIYDVGCVMGKSGITEAISMKPRYDDDITDFNRLRSVGVSTTYGFNATEFDADTATDTSRIAQNCGIWLAYSGSLTA